MKYILIIFMLLGLKAVATEKSDIDMFACKHQSFSVCGKIAGTCLMTSQKDVRLKNICADEYAKCVMKVIETCSSDEIVE